MTPLRLHAALVPLADIVIVTALAFVTPMGMEIATATERAAAEHAALEADAVREAAALRTQIAALKTKAVKQRKYILWLEEFFINCMSGRNMVVGRVDGVMCIKI